MNGSHDEICVHSWADDRGGVWGREKGGIARSGKLGSIRSRCAFFQQGVDGV